MPDPGNPGPWFQNGNVESLYFRAVTLYPLRLPLLFGTDAENRYVVGSS